MKTPIRASKNPIVGLNRCECGEIRTIHRANGKRKKFLYSICDECGTNQQTGEFVQSKFRDSFPTIDELLASENSNLLDTGDQEKNRPVPVVAEVSPDDKKATGCSEPEQQKSTRAPQQNEPEPATAVVTKKRVIIGLMLGLLTGGIALKFM